jgi:hypothetical protein
MKCGVRGYQVAKSISRGYARVDGRVYGPIRVTGREAAENCMR